MESVNVPNKGISVSLVGGMGIDISVITTVEFRIFFNHFFIFSRTRKFDLTDFLVVDFLFTCELVNHLICIP